jgi:hypothetical protein
MTIKVSLPPIAQSKNIESYGTGSKAALKQIMREKLGA